MYDAPSCLDFSIVLLKLYYNICNYFRVCVSNFKAIYVPYNGTLFSVYGFMNYTAVIGVNDKTLSM